MNSDRAHFDIESGDLDDIIARTADVWSALRGERVFITGGTGFFGKWLVGSLLRANKVLNVNVRACILSRAPDDFRAAYPDVAGNACITLHRGDVSTFAFPAGSFSHILHAATDTSLAAHGKHTDHLDAITTGTRRVLEFAASCDATDLLFTSSGAVYGQQPVALAALPESYNGAPQTTDLGSLYGSGKRFAETLCAVAGESGKLRTKIARCFAFVGPHLPLDGHFAIGNFIRDAMERDRIEVRGDGRPLRSYLYAADLTTWLWAMLVRGKTLGVYNVGSDAAISIRQVAEITADTLAPQKPVRVQFEQAPGVSGSRYVPNIDLARSELGLDVWTPLPEAVRRTGSWYKNKSLQTPVSELAGSAE